MSMWAMCKYCSYIHLWVSWHEVKAALKITGNSKCISLSFTLLWSPAGGRPQEWTSETLNNLQWDFHSYTQLSTHTKHHYYWLGFGPLHPATAHLLRQFRVSHSISDFVPLLYFSLICFVFFNLSCSLTASRYCIYPSSLSTSQRISQRGCWLYSGPHCSNPMLLGVL